MRHRRLTALLAVSVSIAWLALVALPAAAACHVAGFVEPATEAGEAEGEAVVIVELRGRVGTCAGTVDVATADATATAGEDYEAVSTTLTFEEGDDRVETVALVLLDDDELESDETFEVVLSNPTGGISDVGDPALVTIVDDEEADAAGDADADGADEEGPVDETIEDVTADEAASEDEGDGGGSTLLLVAVAVLVAVGAGLLIARRRS